jgi:hypothetical protein
LSGRWRSILGYWRGGHQANRPDFWARTRAARGTLHMRIASIWCLRAMVTIVPKLKVDHTA